MSAHDASSEVQVRQRQARGEEGRRAPRLHSADTDFSIMRKSPAPVNSSTANARASVAPREGRQSLARAPMELERGYGRGWGSLGQSAGDWERRRGGGDSNEDWGRTGGGQVCRGARQETSTPNLRSELRGGDLERGRGGGDSAGSVGGRERSRSFDRGQFGGEDRDWGRFGRGEVGQDSRSHGGYGGEEGMDGVHASWLGAGGYAETGRPVGLDADRGGTLDGQ
ncbi:hypothetical protein T484DRAFT_1762809, partial [Baffinella frigidus]